MQTVESIVDYAARHGIATVGITNHVWDREIPGASEWYAPQDFDHISRIREQIPRDCKGVRVRIGAETEFAGGVIALTRAHRDALDYVLVPHSHIHMVGLVLPRDRVTDAEVAAYLVESFLALVQQDFATSIAHPFCPIGRTPENTKAILDCISDDEFARCFLAAREHGAAIEINGDCLHGEASLAAHERMFAIARDCGATFTLGSDAHALAELDNIYWRTPSRSGWAWGRTACSTFDHERRTACMDCSCKPSFFAKVFQNILQFHFKIIAYSSR